MFTFLNDSFRIYTTNGIRKIENGKFLWQKPILFSSNQCLIHWSVGNDFENCAVLVVTSVKQSRKVIITDYSSILGKMFQNILDLSLLTSSKRTKSKLDQIYPH